MTQTVFFVFFEYTGTQTLIHLDVDRDILCTCGARSLVKKRTVRNSRLLGRSMSIAARQPATGKWRTSPSRALCEVPNAHFSLLGRQPCFRCTFLFLRVPEVPNPKPMPFPHDRANRITLLALRDLLNRPFLNRFSSSTTHTPVALCARSLARTTCLGTSWPVLICGLYI